jgi:hypothetical protein
MRVIEASEYLSQATVSSAMRYRRVELLEAARRYARALDSLSRVG